MQQQRIVVMGVAGCGKSQLAQSLAGRLGCEMLEGDDHHLPASIAKMRAGIPLDDADRLPWLDRLGALMAADAAPCLVVSCSALKRRYRDQLRAHVAGLLFVYVEIDVQTAARRVAARSGHLFPIGLVTSQFAALESPVGEDGVLRVSALQSTGEQAEEACRWLAGSAAELPMQRV